LAISVSGVISYFWKIVPLQAPFGRQVIFIGSALKYSLALLYQLFPNRWVRKSGIIFAMTDNGEAPFIRVEDIHVVCHYPDVFPSELRGVPPTRVASFEIKLIPGTIPIHKSPYRMAPKEQLELKKQLDDLFASHHGHLLCYSWRIRMTIRDCVWTIVTLMR
jgi:hypothetical protein